MINKQRNNIGFRLMNPTSVRERAFTLIELLVGITIVSTLFGYGFVSYRDFTRRQALSSFSKQVQGDVRLTQTNALSGIKPQVSACDNTYVLDHYGFRVVSSDQYDVFAKCSKVGVQTEVVTKSVTLPEGITLTIPSVNPITFKVLGEGNNIESGQTVEIRATQTGTNATFSVYVTSGGEVR